MQKNMQAPTGKIVRLGDNAYISVFMNGESLTVRASESQDAFDRALEALKTEDWDALYSAMRPVKAFASKVEGVTVDKNGVFWNGEPVANAVATRIMDFALAGIDHKPLCKFLEKLMLNPSMRAVKELYTFLEHQNLPITDNGNILAYKGVQKDWYSITSGTAKLIKGTAKNGNIFNGVGEEIEMARHDVDDDKGRGCSYGLHAGTMEYATGFGRGGRVVIVEINPKDVVSIPTDCSFQKLRTCAYKVVGEYEGALDKPLYESRWTEPDIEYYDDFHDSHGDHDGDCGDVCDCYEICDDKQFEQTEEVSFDIEVANIVFYTPESSWIESVAWFSTDHLVLFKLDGNTIAHKDVPKSVAIGFENFMIDAGSAGVYYNRNIKNQYALVD
jgi:hypothetical protein